MRHSRTRAAAPQAPPDGAIRPPLAKIAALGGLIVESQDSLSKSTGAREHRRLHVQLLMEFGTGRGSDIVLSVTNFHPAQSSAFAGCRKPVGGGERRRDDAQVRARCRAPKENKVSEIKDDSKPARQPKLLLVEDSFENRDMLSRRLQRRGFTVCIAPDGPAGVAMSVLEKPDIILMDVAMGEMDGWQATRLIKADVRTSKIPIIALTAHALASDRDKSVAVGCADFDTKPVDLARLLGKIQNCLTEETILNV